MLKRKACYLQRPFDNVNQNSLLFSVMLIGSGKLYLKIFYLGAEILYWTFLISDLSGNSSYSSMVSSNHYHFISSYPPILWSSHFLFLWQIYPELKSLHFPFESLGHFLVNYSATGSHPLYFP